MTTKRKKTSNRREEIIFKTADLFDKEGYHGTSMNDVADAVGLGKPTLYHYFRSKTEILYEIHQVHIAKLIDSQLKRENKQPPPDEMLLGICIDILTQIDEHPGFVRAFFEHYGELEDEQKALVRKQRGLYFRMVRNIFKSGTESGFFAKCDPRITALGFLGMCNWAYSWFPSEKRASIKKTAKILCDNYVNGVRP